MKLHRASLPGVSAAVAFVLVGPLGAVVPAQASEGRLADLSLAGAFGLTYDRLNVAPNATSGDRALDRDPATSWIAPAPRSGRRADLLVQLPTTRRVRGIRLVSRTGLRADVYTSGSSSIPPVITDARRRHQRTIRPSSEVPTTYRFRGDGTRARRLLVWVTGAGRSTRRVSISTLRLLG